MTGSELAQLLQEHGVSFVSGVPCSYLGPLLPELWSREGIECVHAPNEGEAVAACAGAALCGRRTLAFMQNSGLGNAVSPLASLTAVFDIPVLLLVSVRGDGGREDEPQHRLMGRITEPMLDLLEIPSERLGPDPDQARETLARACAHTQKTSRPYALLAASDSVGGRPGPWPEPPPWREPRARVVTQMGREPSEVAPTRAQVLERIVSATPAGRSVVVSSTGYASRELYAIADRPSHLYMVGSMGCASALGLGIARSRPDITVVVVEGDGSALMRLGGLPMVGAQAPSNLIHLLLDNGAHESTGGQPTLAPSTRFAEIARASGYGLVLEGDTLDLVAAAFAPRAIEGPRFAHIRIRPGTRAALPRPREHPRQVALRFASHLSALPARISPGRRAAHA